MPEEIREMENPSEMHKAYNWAYLVAVPLYLITGLWVNFVPNKKNEKKKKIHNTCMQTFGVFNSGSNLMLNFKDSNLLRFYLIISTATGYVYTQEIHEIQENNTKNTKNTKNINCVLGGIRKYNKFPKCPPILFRLFFRSCVVSIYVLVAEAMLGFGLQTMVSMVGALSCIFYLPFLFHWKIFRYKKYDQCFTTNEESSQLSCSSVPDEKTNDNTKNTKNKKNTKNTKNKKNKKNSLGTNFHSKKNNSLLQDDPSNILKLYLNHLIILRISIFILKIQSIIVYVFFFFFFFFFFYFFFFFVRYEMKTYMNSFG
eukprot:GSMAST32.ASY1.ANO1.446.1 assembled CDS